MPCFYSRPIFKNPFRGIRTSLALDCPANGVKYRVGDFGGQVRTGLGALERELNRIRMCAIEGVFAIDALQKQLCRLTP
jgi:hypothetical protein